VYTGRLYGERTPKYFLEALRSAMEKEPDMKDKVRAIFVGSCEEFLDGRTIRDYLEEYNLHDAVKLTGHISRKESLEYQMSASVLLLLIGIVPLEMELTYGLSGKVFDYLLSEKPILTLANGGSTREFIVENKIGEIFFHEEIQGISDYLIDAYTRFKNGKKVQSYDFGIYEKFDFRSLSKTLSEQMESIL
jgi:glycosyltransferase involved in cell wall biosynthesis